MKKFLLLILSIFGVGLFSNQCFGYDVVIYGPDNEVLDVYTVEEGTTEIILDGNWSRNGNDFIFLDGYNGTDVHYYDGYGDEKNVNIKSDLYINGDYSILYTGEQDLMLIENSCKVFTGFLPSFEITGGIEEVSESGNIFNNFAQNSVQVLLSNIPSYIQYVIIFMILLFVLGIIRKIKRR